MKKHWKLLLIPLIFLGGFFLYQWDEQVKSQLGGATVSDHNPMKEYFLSQNSFPIQADQLQDLNNDGREDYLVIWRNTDQDTNFMCVVLNFDDRYEMTAIQKAPYENLSIEFKDIDEKEEMEFIVYGSRNGNYGFGIYRVENLIVSNLFGEGLEEC